MQFDQMREQFNMYDTAILMEDFFKIVPELYAPFCEQQLHKKWDLMSDPFSAWVIGVMPCVFSLMEEPKKNADLLQRFFAFVETKIDSDEITQGVMQSGLFDGLLEHPGLEATAESYMKQKTIQHWKLHLDRQRQFQLWQLSQMGGAE